MAKARQPPNPACLPILYFPSPAHHRDCTGGPDIFFQNLACHLDDASLEKYCRPADFFACDTLMQEEVDEPGVPPRQ